MEAVEGAADLAHNKVAPGFEYKVRYAKNESASDNTTLPIDDPQINSHFYNAAVNVNYSSVHIPTYVYDRGK